MNSLVFRKGFKHWKTTFRIEIGFEYTADLEKKLTDVVLHQVDSHHDVSIPWEIFRSYLYNGGESIYAEPNGLTIRPIDDGILVSDSRFLEIQIHADQLEAIRRAAKNVEEDISFSVEKILKEFSSKNAYR